jgi:hypothetical protein
MRQDLPRTLKLSATVVRVTSSRNGVAAAPKEEPLHELLERIDDAVDAMWLIEDLINHGHATWESGEPLERDQIELVRWGDETSDY